MYLYMCVTYMYICPFINDVNNKEVKILRV